MATSECAFADRFSYEKGRKNSLALALGELYPAKGVESPAAKHGRKTFWDAYFGRISEPKDLVEVKDVKDSSGTAEDVARSAVS
jgi:hypothetical protein